MRKIKLDGNAMKEKAEVHTYLKRKLEIKEYDGNNLDALWDVLSTYNKSLKIELIHAEALLTSLGDYGKALLKVFEEAMETNSNIEFRINK